MWRAVANAAKFVRPGGLLYLMLYRDATCAPIWKFIKRFFVASPRPVQFLLRNTFAGVQIAGMFLKHRSVSKVQGVIREYGEHTRGMSWYIDSTDWIGGHPFEFTDVATVNGFLQPKGFERAKIDPAVTRKPFGLRGTGSYQYLFHRVGE